MKGLDKAVKEQAQEARLPAGERYLKLKLADTRQIAALFSCPPGEVELAALRNGIVPERYQRNLGTTGGIEGQAVLLGSRVAVVGLGGLGGTAAELTARMGVKELVLIDGDFFKESNLNRQCMATEENLGQGKAETAAKRIGAVNSAVRTVVFNEFAAEHNIESMLQGCDVVLDCLDNFKARFLLQEACRRLAIPMVHGAIAGFVGQVSTIYPEDKGLQAIYGAFEKGKDKGIEVELGNPAATPALVAAWQVQEAVKLITGRGRLLRKRLLLIDTETGKCELFELEE